MHWHFPLEHPAFRSFLLEGVATTEYFLDIDAEVQKLRQFFFLVES
jgi:hypothetical protein